MSAPPTKEELRLQAAIVRELHLLNFPDANRISAEITRFTQADQAQVNEILSRLKASEPWEYIKGTAEFCGLSFKVTRDVLIPRIETELLVERAASECEKLIKSRPDEQIQIVDVGTGSGAIIISLAHRLSSHSDRLRFTAADISSDALQVAEENCANLLAPDTVDFYQSDLLTTLDLDRALPTLICANLPYISEESYPALQKSVHDYEPSLALIGGVDGLELYRRLWSQIKIESFKKLLVIAEMDPQQIQSYATLTSEGINETIKDQFGVERFVLSYS